MKLPPFEEFEKTITHEKITEWFSADVFMVPSEFTSENAEKFVTIARRAGYYSALGLLKEYHSWFESQMQ